MSRLKSRAPARAVNPKGQGSTWNRYDVWSRKASDAFRWKVAELLLPGSTASHKDAIMGPYDYFTSLGEASWTDFNSADMSLTQVRALFSKDSDMRSPIDGKEAALESFRLSEASCRKINRAFRGNQLSYRVGDVAQVLYYAQRKIAEILGDVPLLSELKPSFGPGSAVTCRKKTTARYKLSTPPSIGEPAVAIAGRLAATMPRWVQLHGRIQVCRGILEFVNKNFKIKRAIVLPPSLTGAVQRAVGTAMKQRLLKAGINLYDQSINREKARLASRSDGDATIDLERASDSIAYMLVLELLPIDWFELLDSLRDSSVSYRDEVIPLEKFSSMGCGFTFELESLLFYSLAYGLARHFDVPFDGLSVYGDDIVAPQALAGLIVKYFPKFGFIPNSRKSFLRGPFRESCGGDYVLGVDVRPFFIKDRMTYHTLVCMYNHFMKKPHQDPDRKIRDLVLQYLPSEFQNYGPEGYGDGHLVSNADIATYCKRVNPEAGWEVRSFETWIELPKRHKKPVLGDSLLPYYQVYLKPEDPVDSLWLNRRILAMPPSCRLSFLRHTMNSIDGPIDHYVIRKPRGARARGKKLVVYVLGG